MKCERPMAIKGSKKWIQLAVNDYPVVLWNLVSPNLHPKPTRINWRSPLRSDGFAEFRDQKSIDSLGLKLKNRSLKSFWPSRGPRWDALAKTDISQVLLVEAKAYEGEIREQGTDASGESKQRIDCSLKETQQFLAADLSIDWSKYPFYQYANRLAHLYLLTELNRIDAYLLMIYFLNDFDMGGPESPELWEKTIQNHCNEMGLPLDHRLSDRIINLYLDVHELGG